METESEPGIVTLTAAQIGTVRQRAIRCPWCGDTAACSWQTTTGLSLCDDCADLARAMGDGRMVLERITYDGIDYTITPPLVLTLSVQYDGAGYRWIQAAAPDDMLGQLLCNEHGSGVSAGDRADISERVADLLVDPLMVRAVLDSITDPCNQGSDPAAVQRRTEYQQHWDALCTRITPPPVPAPPEDEEERV